MDLYSEEVETGNKVSRFNDSLLKHSNKLRFSLKEPAFHTSSVAGKTWPEEKIGEKCGFLCYWIYFKMKRIG